MEAMKLCLQLVECEKELEIIEVLKQNNFWNDKESWQFFGNRENNYGDIGNQQSKADGALVEKLINSVDAVLMAENSIITNSQKDYNAPSSIREALFKFFKIYEGKLTNITARERTSIADKIMLVATGAKSRPSYTIIDRGEGQSPERMPNTLLSLGESNKLRIPFVQGKFNMGGTGVFRFCGTNNLQLIVSKRHPMIAKYESDQTNHLWGFTIIRREDPAGDVRSSTYKYLAPKGKILSFEAESLPVLPGPYPKKIGEPLDWGTFIKLFEYQIGGLKTIITLNMLYRLSLLLPQIALPIRLIERRKEYKANSYETTLSGLEVRLEEDKTKNLEENFPTSGSISVRNQKIKYSIYAFKKNKEETYTNNEGIIFLLNGQTQGHLSKAFFSRKKIGLQYLADSILVILDCSEFTGRAREDLFKNDRETLISCDLKNEIETFLEDELRNHKGLRILKEKRRREEIQNKLEESKPLADILNNLIKKSPSLSRLFIGGRKLTNPFKVKTSSKSEKFKGAEFPTYFTLVKKYSFENPKIGKFDGSCRIKFKTDVKNDYFDRSKDPGNFKLMVGEREINSFSINLWNGTATLTIPLIGLKNGIKLNFKSTVSDVNNFSKPFEEDFYIQIKNLNFSNGSNGKRKSPSNGGSGSGAESIDALDMPRVIPVKRKEWDEYRFDEYSAMIVKGSEEDGYDFYINVDNIHLLTELKFVKEDEIKLIEARYKYAMILIGLSILNSDAEPNESREEEVNVFDYINKITRMVSPVILPMISTLGSLEINEAENEIAYN